MGTARRRPGLIGARRQPVNAIAAQAAGRLRASKSRTCTMVSLLIRNVDPELHATLKARAAAKGWSMEDEAWDLIPSG